MKKYSLLIVSFFTFTLQNEAQPVSDADGNTYNTVTIGTQIWMKENLKTTKYNDGIAIPNVTSLSEWTLLTTPAYCWNNNNIGNKVLYGALYNWYTVNTGKLCPSGWHVPGDGEWTILVDYLIANGYNYDGTTNGNKIAKALASTANWDTSIGTGAIGNTDYPAKRNATGFSAMPGGAIAGGIANVGFIGFWWSSTEYDESNAYLRYMIYNKVNIDIMDDEHEAYKYSGYSVRCIKDSNTSSVNSNDYPEEKFIYPNPATDRLFIRNDMSSTPQLMIFDLQGKQLVDLLIGSEYIDISTLAKGMYIVKIASQGQTIIEKLIKE